MVQAQSITTTTGGVLTRASLYLRRTGETSSPLCADLWSSAGGGPREFQQPLGCIDPQAVLSAADGWVEMNFDSSPYMKPGSSYAIVLYSDAPFNSQYQWVSSLGSSPDIDGNCSRDDYLGGIGSWAYSDAVNGYYPNVDGFRGDQGSCGDKLFVTYNTVDTTAPTGTIQINNGATRTTTRAVTLNLSANDTDSGVTQMRFKNRGTDTVWSAWQPYKSSRSWYLTPGEGTKRVAAQFKDAAGNRSAPVYDYIVFKR
jgi:hypothetical protein